MNRRVTLSIGLLSLALMGVAQKAAPPQRPLPEIVAKMIRAYPSLKMSGTRVVEVREGPRLFKNREFVLKDGKSMRTWFPQGSPREGEVVVEDGKTRRHFFPQENRILITQLGRDQFGGSIGRMARRATIEVKEGEDVAGRPTTVALMKDPRGNVRQKLWIDRRTFAVLKREIYDEGGVREGSFEYVQIDFSPAIKKDDFTIRRAGAQELTIQDYARLLGRQMRMETKVLPDNIPDISLRSVRIIHLPRGPVLHQTFETPDGILSLFQVPPGNEEMRVPPGALRWRDDKGRYALVGPNQGPRLNRLAQALGKAG